MRWGFLFSAAVWAGVGMTGCHYARADPEPPGMAVWLMVQKREDGVTRYYLDARRPTIGVCLEEAGEVLRAAYEHPGDYEIRVTCAVRQTPKDPA